MAAAAVTASPEYVSRRLRSIIWTFLDTDMIKSAHFYAERLYVIDPLDHEARHLYATALLRCKQTQSAMNISKDLSCVGCTEIYARCCDTLGKNRQGWEALQQCIKGGGGEYLGESLRIPYKRLIDSKSANAFFYVFWVRTASTSQREPRQFPSDAILHCRSGSLALRGNMPEQAIASYQKALSLDPFLWEAFEGLCALGTLEFTIARAYTPDILAPQKVRSQALMRSYQGKLLRLAPLLLILLNRRVSDDQSGQKARTRASSRQNPQLPLQAAKRRHGNQSAGDYCLFDWAIRRALETPCKRFYFTL